MQRNPCDLGGTKSELGISPVPSRGGPSKWTKSEVATSPGPSQGPTKMLHTFLGHREWAEVLQKPCVLRGPHQKGRKQKWLDWPCLLGRQRSRGSPSKGTKSELVTSLYLRGRATRGQNCYITLAFSGAHECWEVLHHVFLGEPKGSEVLHNPAIFRGPHQVGQNEKWLQHPCLLCGPSVAISAA